MTSRRGVDVGSTAWRPIRPSADDLHCLMLGKAVDSPSNTRLASEARARWSSCWTTFRNRPWSLQSGECHDSCHESGSFDPDASELANLVAVVVVLVVMGSYLSQGYLCASCNDRRHESGWSPWTHTRKIRLLHWRSKANSSFNFQKVRALFLINKWSLRVKHRILLRWDALFEVILLENTASVDHFSGQTIKKLTRHKIELWFTKDLLAEKDTKIKLFWHYK